MLRAVYGDPRAAVEAVPLLTDRQAAGIDPLPTDPAALAPLLLRERRAEIRTLPDETRLLLLLAAADQYPVPTDAFLRAVMAARLDTRSLDAAESAGIAHAGAGGVVFRDAWTRIAAYESGSPADRRDVHRLLARVLGGAGETPWRSWHRGAGALGPSGRLAAELGAAAHKAGTGGRLSLARALAERAAVLCPDPAEQARLVARAAAYAWLSGDGDRARGLAAAHADDALTGVLALRAGNASEAFDALLTGVVGGGSRAMLVGPDDGVGSGAGAADAGVDEASRATTGRASSRLTARAQAGSAVVPAVTAGAAVTADVADPAGVADASVAANTVRAPHAARLVSTAAAPAGVHVSAPASARADHLLARATEAAIYTGDLRRLREATQVADRLGLVPPGTLGGLVAAFDGRYADARDLLSAAAAQCGPGGDPTVLIHAGIADLLLGDHTRAATATVRAAASARARGTPVAVAQAMEFRAYADFWTGRPRAGEAAALDGLWQAHATGQDNGACHLRAALAMFAALTADADLCRERAATARSYALAHGLGLPAALAQWALAFLDLSSGRFDAAAARLRALAGFGPGHGHRAIRHLATPHYVEAAVRTGDTRVARVAHADYDRWANAVRSPDDLALSARCRALLAPGAEAVDHYRTALGLHSRGTRDFERARTELLFGSALRRLRRRTEARDRLHSALEAFDSFGAPHCAAQARTELRALGTPARSGADTPTAHRLTAQQLLIARMAAEGATNREIAARLALSPRTIDHHLRGVFTRLGIRSRIELVRIVTETDGNDAVQT
ncbi:LuxR C-terminal-related transcriptional regulator [Streptomyces muensis]|uniref:LuxR C-terminal-related transcriptional regulator n=1 Tax=Streptomyces muensis TaxID=1077944 RepID=A0A9X1TJZ4_STRM4|nr:LuxR family transcriptional regulator [Streptomyces muensis]MCF1593832.1 LuxR C-terminal-related transcriptional regulator [Streptomyces muensis]